MDNRTSPTIVEFRLRQIMDQRDLTPADVSKKTGLSRNGVYLMLEKMPRSIRFATIGQLCVGLDILPGDLIVVRRPAVRR